MPTDIFDEIAPASQGDIFDEIASNASAPAPAAPKVFPATVAPSSLRPRPAAYNQARILLPEEETAAPMPNQSLMPKGAKGAIVSSRQVPARSVEIPEPTPGQQAAKEFTDLVLPGPFNVAAPVVETVFHAPEAPITGAKTIAEGIDTISGASNPREVAGGAHQVIAGAFDAATPLMVVGGVTAPIKTGVTLAAGIGAQKGVESGLDAMGLPKEYAAVAGDLAGLIAGAAAHRVTAKLEAIKEKVEPILKQRLQQPQTPLTEVGPTAEPIAPPKPWERVPPRSEPLSLGRPVEPLGPVPDRTPAPKGPKTAEEAAQVFQENPPQSPAAESAEVFERALKSGELRDQIPDETPVPKGPKSARESAETFQENPVPPAQASADVFDQVLRTREQQAAAEAQKRAVEVPETGIPEGVARGQDARERLAKDLLGKPWDQVTNAEANAIDSLIAENNGTPTPPKAVQPGHPAARAFRPKQAAPEAPAYNPEAEVPDLIAQATVEKHPQSSDETLIHHVNAQGADLLHHLTDPTWIREDARDIGAFTVWPGNAEMAAVRLEAILEEPGLRPATRAKIQSLVDTLREQGNKPAVVVNSGSKLSPKQLEDVFQEELDHITQHNLGGQNGVTGHIYGAEDFAQHPLSQPAIEALTKAGYENDPEALAGEIGVRLAKKGRYQELRLSPQNARDLAADYVRRLRQAQRLRGNDARAANEFAGRIIDAQRENRVEAVDRGGTPGGTGADAGVGIPERGRPPEGTGQDVSGYEGQPAPGNKAPNYPAPAGEAPLVPAKNLEAPGEALPPVAEPAPELNQNAQSLPVPKPHIEPEVQSAEVAQQGGSGKQPPPIEQPQKPEGRKEHSVRVVRWQQSPGEPEIGSAGATWYLADNEAARTNNPYTGTNRDSVSIGSGGNHLVEREIQFKNPLVVDYEDTGSAPPKQLGTQIIEKLSPLDRNEIESIAFLAEPGNDNLSYLSEELHIPETRLMAAIQRGMAATYDETGVVDAIAVELLKTRGYDGAIQSSADPSSLREVLSVPSSELPAQQSPAAQLPPPAAIEGHPSEPSKSDDGAYFGSGLEAAFGKKGSPAERAATPQGEPTPPRSAHPAARAFLKSEEGSATSNIAAMGIPQFIEADVKPKLANLLRGGKETVDAVVNLFAPRAGVPMAALDEMYRMRGGREAAQFLLERKLDQWSARVGRLSRDEMVGFIDRMKAGKPQVDAHGKLDSELQDCADFIRQADDQLYRDIQKYKPSVEYLENHFRVLWKTIPGSQQAKGGFRGIFRRPLKGSAGFLKQHTLDSMSEGIKRGGVPYSYNPIHMFEAHYADAMKFVTANRMWEGFKKLGVAKFVKHGTDAPEGYVPLDDNIAKVWFKGDQGMVHAGDWYVEENSARVLNNFLSRDLIREHAAGRALMGIKNATTAIELSLSPFHFVFEANEAVGSSIGIGLRKIWNIGVRQRNPKAVGEGLRDIATAPLEWIPGPDTKIGENMRGPLGPAVRAVGAGVRALGTPARALRRANIGAERLGAFAREAFADEAAFAKTPDGQAFLKQYPDAKQFFQDYFQGGGKMGMHEDYRLSAVNGFKQALADHNLPGAAFRALPGINELIMRPLFEHYIPNLKLGMFVKEMALSVKEHADRLASGEITREKLARDVVDSIENRFGEMNFDNLYWNRTFKTALQMMFRSVTWKLGNLRANVGAVTGELGEMKRAIQKRELPMLHQNTAWLLGMSLHTVVLGSLVMKAATGKWPTQLKDFVYPEVDDKNKIRVSLPTYWRDIVHLAHSRTGYVKSSLSGEIGRVADLWQNKDFYGNEIWHPDDPLPQKTIDMAAHMVPLPFSIASGKEAGREGGTGLVKAAGFLGATKAPRYIEQTPFQQQLSEYMGAERKVGARTKVEAERSQLRSTITRKFRQHEDPSQQINEGIAGGLLNRKDVMSMRKSSKKDPDVAGFEKMSLDKAVNLWGLANDEEKKKLRRSMQRRIMLSWGKPWEMTPDIRQKLADLGFRVPRATAHPAAIAARTE